MNELELIKRIKKQLGNTLLESGGVFSSPKDTLKKGDFYLLGLNPGQAKISEENRKKWTIEYGLDNLNHHIYADAKWGKYEKNKAPFQRSVRSFFEAIGAPLLSTCCTNLYFIRTQDQKELMSRINDDPGLRKIHLNVHLEILKVIRPKTVIFFSAKAYYEFKSMLGLGMNNPNEVIVGGSRREIESGYKSRVIRLRRFRTLENTEYNIIWVPHFSRYAFYNLPIDTQKIIGSQIREFIKITE